MPIARVHIVALDYPFPSGGVLHLYRMTDLLNQAGYEAQIVHQKPGFRVDWFPNTTPVAYNQGLQVQPADYVVIPEIMLAQVGKQIRRLRKIVYNQNAYLTFHEYGLNPDALNHIYGDPDIRASIVVSEDSRRYLEWAFPDHPVFRHFLACDPFDLFAFEPLETKLRQVAFMPRRNVDHAEQVISILTRRGILGGPKGWKLVKIDGLPLAQAAQIIRQSRVFLSFGYPEGFSLPPAEAMSAGTIAIGYHGCGGREYFTLDTGFPIEMGNILQFAQAAEMVLGQLDSNLAAFDSLRHRAAALIRGTYNVQAERDSILAIWQKILALH